MDRQARKVTPPRSPRYARSSPQGAKKLLGRPGEFFESDFRQRVAARFDAAATTYDAHSPVQRHAAVRLAGLIATAGLPPRPRVLEIGCGTGHLTERLALHLPAARIIATDIAPAMVAVCRARLGDAPRLAYAAFDGMQPAVSGPFDLVCANLATQWFVDQPATLAQLTTLLAPGGLLALSLLGAATFREWRAAHARWGLSAGTLPFPDTRQCLAAFPAGQLQLDIEMWADRPASGLDFLRSLRAIGADTPMPGHAQLSPARLRRVLRELGAAPAISYELIYACWHAGKTSNLA